MERDIFWKEPAEKELEKRILAAYSRDEVQKHLNFLTARIRRAGTEGELEAANYIVSKLEEYGVDADLYEFDAYISHPGEGAIEILSPVQRSVHCLPRAFIVSTPPEGIEAELLFLGKGRQADYQGKDARGKIVLIEPGGGQGRMEGSLVAEANGALAQIHITSGRPGAPDIGQIRYTWGSPTPDTLDKVPQTPAVSICHADGQYLAELAKKGPVVVKLKAEASRGYKKVREPIGTLKGCQEPEKFVLCASHYCSWFTGATDNATSNSLLLEMARIFAQQRRFLNRGIKFAWWPGHEQGTYAGSTWFADNFWADVRDNAVAYLTMDGLGRAGTSGFEVRTTEEIGKFYERVVRDVLGLEVKSRRVTRSGDQSFWGVGIPSFTGSTAFPVEQPAAKGEGPSWYLHTLEDRLDKVDMEVLSIPFKVNAVSILRLCNSAVLPYEFVTMADLLKQGLTDRQGDGGSPLDLSSLVAQVEELQGKAAAFDEYLGERLSDFGKKRTVALKNKFTQINICLMELSRILLPILSTKVGKYGQDPWAMPFEPIPILNPLERMKSIDRDGEEYRALLTSLVRERNKISDAFTAANRVLGRARQVLGTVKFRS